ncbi:MAG: DUF4401 domain-containing protein [Sedimenticolaceae bacterium]
MSTSKMTLHDVAEALQAEKLLSADDAAWFLNGRADLQPWYIRTMVGFGAWLASLLLIGFVASFSLAMDGGYAFIGLALIVGAVLLRHRTENDFLIQCALASSLAGQALFGYGFAETVGHDEFEIFLGFALVVSAVLFFVFPDRIHRVVMVLLATGSLTTLLFVWKANSLVPLLGPVFVGALILLQRQMPSLISSRYSVFVRPLMNGLVLSAFGVLLLSTVYVLPELGVDFQFYPRPWISTILLGALFLYVGTQIRAMIAAASNMTASLVFYGMMLVIIACSWAAPGLLLGLIIVMLGAESGSRTFTGAGIVFFSIFLAAYFYGIEVSMLTKSITLVASGAAILVSRWAVLRTIATREPRGPGHA